MNLASLIATLSQASDILFTPANMLVVPLGLVLGVIVGALPGMSAPMGTALVLPFTFFMPPVTALLLLLGVYKGGIYGGSIPAILFNTPGTVAASCTTLDGYPLSQQGKSRKALDMALYASVFADVISNFALILFTGSLASLALQFGAPEMFALIFFALFVVASISGDQLFKGIFTMLLGLLFATIGTDSYFGSQRFAFGNISLLSGLSVLPLLVGLFALSEIFYRLLVPDKDAVETRAVEAKGGHLTLAEFTSHLPVIIRGSLIGTILGAIPGIGASPAAFFSYSEARRLSKNQALFGKGSLEGVAAAESANNGVCSSSFIPVLALGIPGGTAAAVIMAAFLVHGITPGPILFKENLGLVYSLYLGLMLGSVVLLLIGLVGVRLFARMVDIPAGLLFPSVLVMCVFGSYAAKGDMFDVHVMVFAGLVGGVFRLFALPAAPFLIGFILGPLLENAFRDTLLQSDSSLLNFVSSWIAVAFWVLSASSLFFIVRGKMQAAPDTGKDGSPAVDQRN
jgi:putative tricarboxylic transport membrane protein